MEMFSIDLTPQEISVLRQALDTVTLTGKDAKFIATLQIKLETEIMEIQKQLKTPASKGNKTSR
jgi:hypothetical protein